MHTCMCTYNALPLCIHAYKQICIYSTERQVRSSEFKRWHVGASYTRRRTRLGVFPSITQRHHPSVLLRRLLGPVVPFSHLIYRLFEVWGFVYCVWRVDLVGDFILFISLFDGLLIHVGTFFFLWLFGNLFVGFLGLLNFLFGYQFIWMI